MTAPRKWHGQSHQGGPLSRRAFLRQAVRVAGGGLLARGLGAGSWLATARRAAARSPAAKPNIILLTADSLRADHMGAYGYARPTTPHLDRLASESSLFEYAFAPISYTGPSLASLHTGKYPQEHFMGFSNGKAPYLHTDLALAELLKAHGYQTAAFVRNGVLEQKRSQMDKGFVEYHDAIPYKHKQILGSISEVNAPETTAAVLQWLKTQAKPPFFLWVHYIEPHGPYTPPSPYHRMFFDDALYRAEPRLLELSPEQRRGGKVAPVASAQGAKIIPRAIQYLEAERDARGKVLHFNPRVADHIARYDGKIRYLDEAVGELLKGLNAQGLSETCWLVFASDHGESLGEQGYYFLHGGRVTLELLCVPLLVRPPGAPAPRRVRTQVSLIDLMPTLLEAVGIEQPGGLSGQSILSLLRDEGPSSPRLVFSDMGYQYSCIDDRYQLLVGYDLPTLREKKLSKKLTLEFGALPVGLFDYRSDPLGARDLAREERPAAEARFGQLRAFLEGYLQRVARIARVKRPPVQDSAETKEILKQLGY